MWASLNKKFELRMELFFGSAESHRLSPSQPRHVIRLRLNMYHGTW